MSKRRTTAVHQPDPDSPFAQARHDELDQTLDVPPFEDVQAMRQAEDEPTAIDPALDPELGDTGDASETLAATAALLGAAVQEGLAPESDLEAPPAADRPRAPRTGHLPFGDTRFNADAAVRTIGDIAIEIEQLKAEWDHQKSLAADAKKAYDERVESLLKIIDRLRTEQIRAVTQPALREVDEVEAAPARTSCPWEQAHPGQRCAICADREQRRTDAPGADSPEHPQHLEHEAAADARRSEEIARLKTALVARTFYIAEAELEALPAADLRTLVAWAQSPGVVPPPLMLRACIAGAVDPDSGLVQACTRCDKQLWARATDLHQAGLAPFTANALVGLDCQGEALDGEGQPLAAAAPSEASVDAEPARKPAKRGTRKGATKHDPEAERAEQVKAGRKRAKA